MTCPICFDVFNTAVIGCENNHHFCEGCFLQLPTSTKSDGIEHANCPVCKEWCFADAQPDRLLNALVEQYLADHPRGSGDARGPSRAGQAMARRSPRRMRTSAHQLRRVREDNNQLQQTAIRNKREADEQKLEATKRTIDFLRMRHREATDDLEFLLLMTIFCVGLYKEDLVMFWIVVVRFCLMLLEVAFRIVFTACERDLCRNDVLFYAVPNDMKLLFCVVYVGLWCELHHF